MQRTSDSYHPPEPGSNSRHEGTSVFTRTMHRSREFVFKRCTEAEHVACWWGPYHFTNPLCLWEARPGGHILIYMRAPDGMEFRVTGSFHEVQEPERLVFTTRCFESSKGIWELEVLVTLILTTVNEKTNLTLEATLMKASAEFTAGFNTVYEGWNQSLNKLAALIHNNQQTI
ncbi:MAG TPA: SRPBCC domain-containing protein [Chitinophagaceae bacterium]